MARPDVPDRFIDGHVEVIENNLAVSLATVVRFHKLFRDNPSLDGTVGGDGLGWGEATNMKEVK